MKFIDRIIKPPYTYKQKMFDELKSSPYPNYIYGAGKFASCLTNELTKNEVPFVRVVVDDKYYVKGMKFNKISIEPFSNINAEQKANIIVAFGIFNDESKSDLDKRIKNYHNLNFKLIDSGIYPSGTSVIDNYNLSYIYILEHLTEFDEIYRLCADDISRDVFVNFINLKLTGDLSNLTIITENQYFQGDLFKLNDSEIFIDCGAYDGDTIRSFTNLVNNKYSKIYAFEPDINNLKKLKQYVGNNHIQNIELSNYGVWNKNDILYFSNNGDVNSNITDDNSELRNASFVSVVSIDETIPENENVSFIKMDIEGSELMALKGAENTIKRCKPKLAVCVYHKKEDLYSIPLNLIKMHPDYKIYFRQHTFSSSEMVLYAV